MMLLISRADRAGLEASIRAATPAAKAAATGLPLIEIHEGLGESNPLAATSSVPGAATSGLCLPSQVGPLALAGWIVSFAWSRLATVRTLLAQARPLTANPGTA